MLTFWYKNHRGQLSERTVKPVSLDYMPVPNNGYGYAPGWFLTAEDYTRERNGILRSFALTNIQLPEDNFRTPSNGKPIRFNLR